MLLLPPSADILLNIRLTFITMVLKNSKEAAVMAKVGRPKSESPKDERVTIRLREESMRRLKAYAERMGITKTEALIKGLDLLLEQENGKEEGPVR